MSWERKTALRVSTVLRDREIAFVKVYSAIDDLWAIIDSEDIPKVIGYRWGLNARCPNRALVKAGTDYVLSHDHYDGTKLIMLHRRLMGLEDHDGKRVKFRRKGVLYLRKQNMVVS